MSEINQIKKLMEAVHYPGITGRGDSQQVEFKKMLPKIEYVLNKHSSILTGKEKKVLQNYYAFASNKLTSMDQSAIAEAKTIIKYLGRV